MLSEMSPAAIDRLLKELPNMPLAEKAALLDEIEQLEHKKKLQECRDDFLAFCRHMYPDWKEGPHHRYMRPLLHKVKDGTETRLTVSMPPRFGKSHTIAYLFVSWYLGHHPSHHIMMVTHTASLSADFGRNVRNLIDTAPYKEIFPETIVSKDKSASDNWTTSLFGKYLAIGIGANVAGHGAHCLHPETRVAGGTTIGEAKVGDRLLTKGGWRSISKKLVTTHPFYYTINDDLKASWNHPFYTQAGWVYAKGLKVGDRIETLTFWKSLWAKILRRNSRQTNLGAV